jgi:hypothetical protein
MGARLALPSSVRFDLRSEALWPTKPRTEG